jgi:hypothetical protein
MQMKEFLLIQSERIHDCESISIVIAIVGFINILRVILELYSRVGSSFKTKSPPLIIRALLPQFSYSYLKRCKNSVKGKKMRLVNQRTYDKCSDTRNRLPARRAKEARH